MKNKKSAVEVIPAEGKVFHAKISNKIRRSIDDQPALLEIFFQAAGEKYQNLKAPVKGLFFTRNKVVFTNVAFL